MSRTSLLQLHSIQCWSQELRRYDNLQVYFPKYLSFFCLLGRKYAMLKLKVLLATILRRFKVKSTVEEKDFVLQGDIILKRTDGFMIQLEDRQKIC